MKTFLTVAAISMFVSGAALAGAGGAPGAHGVSGKDWGGAVSSTAQSGPGALADHTSGGKRQGK